MSGERLLLLFPSHSYRVDAFVSAARRAGVELTLGTDRPHAFAELGCPVLLVSFGDPGEAAASLASAAGATRWAGVVPTDENSAVVAALLAERLGLPHATVEGARAARDKRRMRERLAEAGVSSPRFTVLARGRDPREILAGVRFPCVVKPPMLSGSQGVIRADDEAALGRAVHRIRTLLERHPSQASVQPAFHDLLVEDYLPGREVAVEAVMTRGTLRPLAIFDKPDDLCGPYFEETLYVTPSRLPQAAQEDLLDVTGRAARALGLAHGPIHAELRTFEGRASVVEVAGRSIGGLCSRVFELAAGPLEDVLLAHACGRPIDELPALRARAAGAPGRAAGVMMMPIQRSGVLRDVGGLDAARAVPGVEGVTLAVEPGEAVRALPEGGSYLGFLFARGDTPEAVERSLRAGFARLELTWTPLLATV